jgi:hypothetical protein
VASFGIQSFKIKNVEFKPVIRAHLFFSLGFKLDNRLYSHEAVVKVTSHVAADSIRCPRFDLVRVFEKHLAASLLETSVVPEMHLKLTEISEAAFIGRVELECLDVGATTLIVLFILAVQDAHHVPASEVAHILE